MSTTTIEKAIFIKATAETVWRYLTEADKLSTWFHRPTSDLDAGVKYEMLKADSGECFMSGRVLKAEPFTRLEYEFHIPQMGENVSLVKWNLEEVAGGVRLSLSHSNLPQGEPAFGLLTALDKGWDEHLGAMRTVINA